MKETKLYVLLRASKKTGKVDTCMTGITHGLMAIWALNHTTKTKRTLIIERDTGIVTDAFEGSPDGLKIDRERTLCTAYGIPVKDITEITDERFDN